MERKLATIRRISDIQPIPGADKIEVATVDGWKVVVAKDVGHKVGDLVVYCEIDSFLPIREEYEFLRKSSYKKMADDSEGFRLRTVKLRNQISQGLILPMSVFEGYGYRISEDLLNESPALEPNRSVISPEDMIPLVPGQDVTQILGIVKYDPPIPAELAGVAIGNFPSWGRKTDQERVQNLVDAVEKEISDGSEFEITIKLDGTSMSIGRRNDEIVVCSRNLSLSLEQTGNTMVEIAKSKKILENISNFDNIMISGELCGPGIQGNKEKLKEPTFFVFDIFDVDRGVYLDQETRYEIVEKMGLEHVPILHKSAKLQEIGLRNVDDILKYANGKSLNSETREGLVFKRSDGLFSFKAISNEFLIEFD